MTIDELQRQVRYLKVAKSLDINLEQRMTYMVGVDLEGAFVKKAELDEDREW